MKSLANNANTNRRIGCDYLQLVVNISQVAYSYQSSNQAFISGVSFCTGTLASDIEACSDK